MNVFFYSYNLSDINDLLIKKLIDIIEDIGNVNIRIYTKPELLLSNAKNLDLINEIKFEAVITSSPYLNGTNYFRNTKLELWFLKIIQFKNDLRYLRNQALICGINDISKDLIETNISSDILNKSNILKKTRNELKQRAYDQRIFLKKIL